MKRFLCIALVLFASSAWGEGWLKQSTAAIIKLGPFVDSGDGVTAETGLTIAQGDIQISKAGGAFAQTSDGSPTTTHDADGWYPVPLTTTDTGTLGRIVVQVQVAGAVPVWWEGMVLPAVVYDSVVAGSDYLQVDAHQVEGGDATDALGTAQTGDTYARLGAPAGASVSADVAAVKAETALIVADTGTDGVVLANDAITAAKIAADAIGASEIATDAIGAAEVAAAALVAGTEITGFSDDADVADAVLDELLSGHTTAGSLGKYIADILEDTGTTLDDLLDTEVAAILADTGELQTDWVNGGRLDLLIDSILADTNEVQLALANGGAIELRFDGIEGATFSSSTDSLEAIRNQGDAAWVTGSSYTVADIADGVWDEAIADHDTDGSGTAGEALAEAGSAGAEAVATAVWEFPLAGIATAGSAGVVLSETADAVVGSGDTVVDHDYGGDCALCFKTAGGVGIGDAVIIAYLTSEYEDGTYTERAKTTTEDDGTWEAPMYLNAGSTYTLVYRHSAYAIATKEIDVE